MTARAVASSETLALPPTPDIEVIVLGEEKTPSLSFVRAV